MSESAKTGVLYCRVSSKEQVEGTSLDMQERLCREYATKLGIMDPKVFVDRGESAKTADRPEFMKAISLCSNKKKPINYFIVYKLDRFARNQDDHVNVRTILRKFGTELKSVTEPINETPFGRAMEGVLSVFAELDNNVRKERSISGMMEQLKKGIWTWAAPIGFYRSYSGSNIEPHPQDSVYIRLLFEEYAKGKYSYRALAKFIGERGFRTRNNKIPFAQLMERIIKNPIYCGIIDVWGMRIKSSFGIVSEELFNQCQRKKKDRSQSTQRISANPNFPLRKVVCPNCRTSITGSYSTGRKRVKYPYYHHHRQNCENAKFIPKETFEQLFVEYLTKITPNKKYEKMFKAIMIDIWQSNYKRFNEENVQINKEVENLEQDRLKIFDLHRAGRYNDEEFVEQKDLINQKIYEKRQLLQESHIEEFNMEESLDYCFNFVRETAKTWLRLTHPNNVRFQNMIFDEKPFFDGEKFGTTKLSNIYAINKESGGKKSQMVRPVGFEPTTFSLRGSSSTN